MSTDARITIADYDRMIEAGEFDLDPRRLELMHGEIREMTPIGPLHEDAVDYLSRWSISSTPADEIRIRIQNSIGIPEFDSAPEPDIVWVRERSYRTGRPTPDNVLLIIEVANSSLRYDLGKKAELYAGGGIADYWVVDLKNLSVAVHRDPEHGEFKSITRTQAGESISPLRYPHAELETPRLFSESA